TEDTADDEPETIWVKLGNFALLFFPRELEGMITRSIPFIIAGLAVALGFKAGLFNIGAEGQLYAGAIIAVFVGYSAIFAGLPAVIHLPLVVVVGIIGGLLWGAIPGALKAYTGAHEVITTIMLNFIAVRFVDWLVNTEGLMRDPNATLPQSPPVVDSARLPRFDLPVWVFIVAAVIFTGVALYLRREEIQRNARAAISPILNGILVFLVGIFLSWITVRDNLHVGLLLMIFAVWFTDWFLTRTTFGFEIRTVGANANAARYGGMSVPRNLVLAMALSGALAGLAGMIEMSGVQYTMQPEFFSGLGFDAIAVALLARTNPRNMIAAGLLWGGLYAGAPLMQTRAEISIDLVRIIQALIIMFIAADAIIRYLWRVPDATPEERAQQMFSTSWGS
ncbi:MAG: ABC transporter permease, partial [Chloroflexota bacterium]